MRDPTSVIARLSSEYDQSLKCAPRVNSAATFVISVCLAALGCRCRLWRFAITPASPQRDDTYTLRGAERMSRERETRCKNLTNNLKARWALELATQWTDLSTEDASPASPRRGMHEDPMLSGLEHARTYHMANLFR